jgi:hypothetical protein
MFIKQLSAGGGALTGAFRHYIGNVPRNTSATG